MIAKDRIQFVGHAGSDHWRRRSVDGRNCTPRNADGNRNKEQRKTDGQPALPAQRQPVAESPGQEHRGRADCRKEQPPLWIAHLRPPPEQQANANAPKDEDGYLPWINLGRTGVSPLTVSLLQRNAQRKSRQAGQRQSRKERINPLVHHHVEPAKNGPIRSARCPGRGPAARLRSADWRAGAGYRTWR